MKYLPNCIHDAVVKLGNLKCIDHKELPDEDVMWSSELSQGIEEQGAFLIRTNMKKWNEIEFNNPSFSAKSRNILPISAIN